MVNAPDSLRALDSGDLPVCGPAKPHPVLDALSHPFLQRILP